MLARIVSGIWLVLVPALVAAQAPTRREPMKQVSPTESRASACPTAAAAPAAPSDEQRAQARDLAQRALQAALLGDSAAARAELRKAAALDAADADLAYRLGRAHEGAGAAAEAVGEYCRFLAIAPNAPDAPEVRGRVTSLAAAVGPDPRVAETLAIVQAGISAYESGRHAEAVVAFGRAIGREPQWPEPYYNRALAMLALGRTGPAVRDLEQFLRLKPETTDRAAIVARIADLRRMLFSPTTALAAGLVVPGGGQYYTRRPMRGLITTLGAGAAFAVALMPRTRTSVVEQTGTDPFGNPYTYTTTRRVRERPYALPGVVVGLGLSVSGAIDAFRYAQRTRR